MILDYELVYGAVIFMDWIRGNRPFLFTGAFINPTPFNLYVAKGTAFPVFGQKNPELSCLAIKLWPLDNSGYLVSHNGSVAR